MGSPFLLAEEGLNIRGCAATLRDGWLPVMKDERVP